jgi:hypothetical protein
LPPFSAFFCVVAGSGAADMGEAGAENCEAGEESRAPETEKTIVRQECEIICKSSGDFLINSGWCLFFIAIKDRRLQFCHPVLT